MDDRRFDSLTKALAEGKSRRTVLKGLLGLGGAALAGSVLLDDDSEAARRPTNPTPTPVRCPGGQTYNPVTRKCDCPAGLSQCAPNGGPACCNDGIAVGPGYSECCDNACCFWPNDCVGEELCCPRLPEVGCLGPDGRCCTTLCEVTPAGIECCPTDEFCPGGSTSPDLCCNGDTPIKCDCGTNGNICLPDTDEACCVDSDCDTPPAGSSPCVKGDCVNHVCVYTDCKVPTEICCPDNLGHFACRTGGDECCLSSEQCADTCEICGPNWVCVDDPLTFPCGDECCVNADTCCNDACCAGPCLRDNDPEFCCTTGLYCPITEGPDECCLDPAQDKCCGQDGCCRGQCYGEGDNSCCPKAEGFICNGQCCPNANTCCTTDEGDETCCAPGQCNASTGQCCAADTFPCGDDCCPEADTCCAGACCEGPCIRNPLEPEICCPADGFFVCDKVGDDECCLDEQDCCATDGCCSGQCYSGGHCCPSDTGFICADGCCPNANSCCGRGTEFEFCCPPGQCNEATGACCATGNTPCGSTCCNTSTHKCCKGQCVARDFPCCESNDDCGFCETCNPGSGSCSSLCTSDAPQCCVNDFGEYCVPAGATCCEGPGDCTNDCETCDSVRRYCVSTCDATHPQCCSNNRGEYCVGQDEICCDGLDDCTSVLGPCSYCSDDGICVDNACTGFNICCHEGGRDQCCQQHLCLAGFGCCFPDALCGAECCSDNQTCCNDSYCIPEGQQCCDDDADCESRSICVGLQWHHKTCGDDGYCVDNVIGCNEFRPCTDYACDNLAGCSSSPTVCDDPPNTVCYDPNGFCDSLGCHYTPLASGTVCDDCLLCDGKGNCNVPDPTCTCDDCGSCGVCTSGECQANESACQSCEDCREVADGVFECISTCEDPPPCFTGTGTCTADGCVYTPILCPPQNCVTSLGCNPGTGQCQYVPISCPPPPNTCVMGGQCNAANGQCEYPLAPSGQQCDACLNCDGSGNCDVPRPAGDQCGLCLLCDGNGACNVVVPDCP